MTQTDNSAVEAKITGKRRGRPPAVQLQVDLTLRNKADKPRWFVLPKDLNTGNPDGGVDTIEAYELKGQGRAVVLSLLGSNGAQAVLVPGGGEVKIEGLAIAHWGDLPQKVDLEVILASDVTLSGKPLRGYAAAEPQSDKHAAVSGAQKELLGSKGTADGQEHKLAIHEEGRVKLSLAVP